MEIEAPRRSHGDSSSPEFEFWMVGNHPELFPQPDLLTADELFVDGVLLPLHLLSLTNPNANPEPESEPASDPPPPAPPSEPEPVSSSISSAPLSSSKRWKDIFKVGEKKSAEEKEKKKERKGSNGGGGGGGGSAELNINIWPFSRSRSAGNGGSGSRPKASAAAAAAMRKSSSAPCSRSNSRGESAVGRKWAASPGRAGGVHVGRTSPVWQIRRSGKGTEPPAAARGADKVGPRGKKGSGSGGVRVLNLNVNTCIGYRNQMSCRGDDNDGVTGGDRTGDGSNNSLFSFRALFSKKVY